MNQTIVVTGAGKGLGYCIAKKHLESGDNVLALEYSITPGLTELAKQHPSLRAIRCDVTSTSMVKTALTPLFDRKKTVHILYNVAGIYFQEDCVPLEETDIDRFLSLYDVNALGQLRVIKEISPLLAKGAVILNVTSEAGSIGSCTRNSEYGYCMSKAAANMGAKILSNQLAARHIRIFCVHPGWLKTDMGGTKALLSNTSITPEESAAALIDIAQNPSSIPDDVMYLDYRKTPLCW